jgi:hypothetical protein
LLIWADANNYIWGKLSNPTQKERKMAKVVKSGKKPITKSAAKPATPKKLSKASDWFEAHPDKKLSKAGEWLKAHPGGICKILDMRAVMK